MRITLAATGSEVALDGSSDLLEKGGTVKQLKQLLAQQTGHSRFCLRLLNEGISLPDAQSLSDLDVQLVVLALAPPEDEAVLRFMQACGEGDIEVVEEVLATPVDPDLKRGVAGLHLAAQSGRREVIELLLEASADINQRSVAMFNEGWTALHFATRNEKSEVIQLLLERGAEMLEDQQGMTPLHCACKLGKLEVVALFLNAKLDLERATQELLEMTPLHCAAGAGHVEIVTLLLEAKAEKDRQNTEGVSAISYYSLTYLLTCLLTYRS